MSTVEVDGQSFLRVDPDAIRRLTAEAMHDISHYLRPGHLAKLRRIIEDPEPAGAGLLLIDSDARLASWDDRHVALSPLEHDLLRSLSEVVGHVRTFDWLQEHVWGNDHPGNRSHVQSLVKRLRRKLRELGAPLQIEAVRGVGLRLIHARPGRSPDA